MRARRRARVPTLVNLSVGLRAAPLPVCDLVVSVGLYALISAVERPVLRRYTPQYSTR